MPAIQFSAHHPTATQPTARPCPGRTRPILAAPATARSEYPFSQSERSLAVALNRHVYAQRRRLLASGTNPASIALPPCFHYCRISAIIGVLPVARLLMPPCSHPSPAPLRKPSQPATTSAALALPALTSSIAISLLIIAASALEAALVMARVWEGFANFEWLSGYRHMYHAAFRLQYRVGE